MALPRNISSGHSPCSLFLGLLLCLHGQATTLRQCRPVPAQDPSLFGLKGRVCAVCSPAAPRAQGLFPPVFGAVGQLCQGSSWCCPAELRLQTQQGILSAISIGSSFFTGTMTRLGIPPWKDKDTSHIPASRSLLASAGQGTHGRCGWGCPGGPCDLTAGDISLQTSATTRDSIPAGCDLPGDVGSLKLCRHKASCAVSADVSSAALGHHEGSMGTRRELTGPAGLRRHRGLGRSIVTSGPTRVPGRPSGL